MLKAYKYRIYPNKEQQEMFIKHFGCVRYIYNKGLETKIKAYEQTGKSPSYCELATKMLIEQKKENEWLREPFSQCLQMALRNLDNAFTRFFREKKGFPKFKSKHRGHQSCQYPQKVKVEPDKKRIIVPKIGGIKTKFSRNFKGTIKTITISKTPTDKYYVSILVDDGKEFPKKAKLEEKTSVGVDLGIKDFCITSKGEKIENPKHLKNSLQRLKVLHRRTSKKRKGGANRRKANFRLAKKYEKVSNQRNDFLHKTSSKLIRDNQTICLEDLNIQGMQKNHRLAQSISDVSWSRFVEFLKYKADWNGKNILQIGRFEPSSKMCSCCGFIKKDLELKDREWECPECKKRHDRDINAAINILKYALVRTGSGRAVELRETLALAKS